MEEIGLIVDPDGIYEYYFKEPVKLKSFKEQSTGHTLAYYNLTLVTDKEEEMAIGVRGARAAIITYLKDNGVNGYVKEELKPDQD